MQYVFLCNYVYKYTVYVIAYPTLIDPSHWVLIFQQFGFPWNEDNSLMNLPFVLFLVIFVTSRWQNTQVKSVASFESSRLIFNINIERSMYNSNCCRISTSCLSKASHSHLSTSHHSTPHFTLPTPPEGLKPSTWNTKSHNLPDCWFVVFSPCYQKIPLPLCIVVKVLASVVQCCSHCLDC